MGKLQSETYQLDLCRYQLRRADGVRVKLERQPMELLILLVENKGRLVTREQVASKLWTHGVYVETEPAINNAIRKIRTALHDSAEGPRYLETVVGKGYRFIGELEVISGPTPAPANTAIVDPAIALTNGTSPAVPAVKNSRSLLAISTLAIVLAAAGTIGWAIWRSSTSAVPGPIRSIAVLPLQNLSGDPSQDYFAEGITDELITSLAKIGTLRVISRTSTMQYAVHRTPMSRIVKDLNVDAVVEGSIVRAGSKVRITAQLIDARHDSHLWAQSYDRDLGDILELQRTVALEIAARVRANVGAQDRGALPALRRVNPEAYEAYLRGRNELGKQKGVAFREGARYFQQAIDLDPFYAAAYSGLSDSFSLMANYAVLAPKDAFPRAEAAARRALDLDPSSAEAHAVLGLAKHHFDWDWPGAEAEYRHAIQLAPELATAHLRYAEFLSNSGRHDEAIREVGKAHEADPLSLVIASNVGRILFYARRYDAAILELQKILMLDPNRAWARIHLALAYTAKHMYPEAIAEFKRAGALLGIEGGVGLAQAYALSGQIDAAKSILRGGVEEPNEAGVWDWVLIASVYEALGDRDAAIGWLEKAYENRDFLLTYLKVYPFLDSVRADPRCVRILDRVGFPKVP
jgi:TolB-like protein/DNA-binding winged helix-turn-helix (wHTH) protein/Flp pilus assembly protein TadD